jgi:hypothetical protein
MTQFFLFFSIDLSSTYSEWEKIKGPYWIIQTELQRHFCLHVIRAKLPLLMRKQSKTLINRLFSTIEFENIENKRLREELPRLQDELQNLLDGVLEKMSIKKREVIEIEVFLFY